MWHPPAQQAILDATIAEFPATFGLAAFPGDVFRIDKYNCYFSEGTLMLYTEIKKGDKWLSFAKGTVIELKREVVK